MPRNKTYTDVTEMTSAAGASQGFVDKLAAQLASRRIVNHLISLRGAKGLSQKHVAEKIGCTQSRISKLENGLDEDLRIGDLKQYAKAMNLNFGLFLADARLRAIDRIKGHAFQIKAELDRLVDLAKDDAEIACGVEHVHNEALYNLIRLIGDSLTQLLAQSATSLPEACEPDDSGKEITVEMRLREPEASQAAESSPA